MFIVLDGPDGCGKTTQATLLATRLAKAGRRVHHLREPGGTALGEDIRSWLLGTRGGETGAGGESLDLHPSTEMLLFFASRMQLVHERVRPALAAGETVVCERFVSSTFAYQSRGSGEDAELVLELARKLLADVFPPDHTFILDLDADQAMERVRAGVGAGDRIESRDPAFHRQVRRGFLEYAERHAESTRVIAVGARTPEQIHLEIWTALALARDE